MQYSLKYLATNVGEIYCGLWRYPHETRKAFSSLLRIISWWRTLPVAWLVLTDCFCSIHFHVVGTCRFKSTLRQPKSWHRHLVDFLLYSRVACGSCNVVRATLMAFTWWGGKSCHTDELLVKHSLGKQRSWPLCEADEVKHPVHNAWTKTTAAGTAILNL